MQPEIGTTSGTGRVTLEQRGRALLASLPGRSWSARFPLLFAEAVVLTWVAFLVPLLFGVGGVELGIFSLFLAAISLRMRFSFLLDEHRDEIVLRQRHPRQAHALTALSLVAMFLGMCAAYLGFVALLDTADARDVFSFVIQRTGLDHGTLAEGRFDAVSELLRRNVGVMAAILILCLLFRAHGAVLVLGWNAAVWVVTLALLTRRTVEGLPLDPLFVRATAAVALIPHLTLELTAYVIAALVGIFVSKAFTRHEWDTPTFFQILRSSGLLLAVGVATLVVAAITETYFTAIVLELLR